MPSPVSAPARTATGMSLAASARWISTAQRSAARALANASMNLSPSRSTSTPPVRSSASRTSRSCSLKTSRARSSPTRSTSGVESTMSVKRTVTVPSGRSRPACTRRRTRRVASAHSTGSPRWTVRIACAISSGRVSFVRKPDAPAASVGSTCSSSPKVESASTFTAGASSRSAFVASTPSTCGMTTSITTTSGPSSRACWIAAAPSSASPTTSTSGSTSRKSRSPWRTTAWSSAMRTRIIDLQLDRRSFARLRAHAERPADRLRPLAHRDQAEVPPRLRAVRVEARAVVLDGDDEPAAVAARLDAHVLRRRVLERVADRLLRYPEDLPLELRRDFDAVERELDVDPVHAPQDVDVLLERDREPVRADVPGAKLEDQRAHLVHRGADELAHLGGLLLRALGLGVDEERGRVGGERDAEERLVHGVVELAREPVPLLDDGELAAPLVEARVLDRNRRVPGERLDQLLVGVVEDRAARALLVGEVEGADHLVGGDDRHAEEGAHARVRVGPALEARVLLDVGEALAARGFEHRAEQAVLAREVADRVVLLLAHPGGDEVREPALAVGDADRRVARAGELPCRVGELLEDGLEAVLGGDRDDGVADRAEGAAVQRFGHGSSRYAA